MSQARCYGHRTPKEYKSIWYQQCRQCKKKVAILLSSIGNATYELLGDLCAPDKAKTKTFEELLETLTEHFQPTLTVISERYKFHLRRQQTGETAIEYIAALRRLAKNCAFGDLLNDALGDGLVCGLASEELLKDKRRHVNCHSYGSGSYRQFSHGSDTKRPCTSKSSAAKETKSIADKSRIHVNKRKDVSIARNWGILQTNASSSYET